MLFHFILLNCVSRGENKMVQALSSIQGHRNCLVLTHEFNGENSVKHAKPRKM